MPLTEIQQFVNLAPLFILVLFRIAALVAFAPLLGMQDIPVRVRIVMALVLTAAVWPMVRPVVWEPDSLVALAVGIGGEIMIGLAMGFILTLMFTGIRVGAEMVSQQIGFSMSEIVDPVSGSSSTLIAQFFILLTMLLYVLMNGHLVLIRSLVDTFSTVPLLSFQTNQTLLAVLLAVLTSAYQMGIRIAGPTLAAVFLATLALGFVSRTMPQLNILAAGFPIRILLSIVLLVASIGMIVGIFEESILYAFRQIGDLFI